MKHKEFYETIHEDDKLANFGNDFRVYSNCNINFKSYFYIGCYYQEPNHILGDKQK